MSQADLAVWFKFYFRNLWLIAFEGTTLSDLSLILNRQAFRIFWGFIRTDYWFDFFLLWRRLFKNFLLMLILRLAIIFYLLYLDFRFNRIILLWLLLWLCFFYIDLHVFFNIFFLFFFLVFELSFLRRFFDFGLFVRFGNLDLFDIDCTGRLLLILNFVFFALLGFLDCRQTASALLFKFLQHSLLLLVHVLHQHLVFFCVR